MPFDYARAQSIDDARGLLARPGAAALGGGTDLLPSVREHVVAPSVVVDLRGIADLTTIEWTNAGVRIGAAVPVSRLANDPDVRVRLPALAEACDAVGSVALRNMGTLGGNLCQRPRCWYFRTGVSCYKNGGSSCPAVAGENQHHAILGGGPCYIVHPSDPAVALLALEATVHVAGGDDRDVPVAGFFRTPNERLDLETELRPGEFVTHVDVPAASLAGRQRYVKLMQRGAWDFALASLAVVVRRDGGVRMALGGVAPVPWRVNPSVEEDVASGPLSDDDAGTLADRALHDARPLSKNAYKVDLARTLIRRGIRFAQGAGA